MRSRQIVTVALVVAAAFAFGFLLSNAQSDIEPQPQSEPKPEDKLVVVWTSGDRDVALSIVFMYVGNSPRFGWWDDITLIVWGASSPLLAEDEELQEKVKAMAEAGIKLEACKACADMYGVAPKLEELGIDVKYMGDVLTSYIKDGRHVLTF